MDLLGKKKDAILELKVTKIEGYSSIMFDEIFRGEYPSSQNVHHNGGLKWPHFSFICWFYYNAFA